MKTRELIIEYFQKKYNQNNKNPKLFFWRCAELVMIDVLTLIFIFVIVIHVV